MILSYPYTEITNYDFDSDKIQISAGKARLKLNQIDIDFTEDFADDTDFIYDDTKAEFSGGQVQQKLYDITGQSFIENFIDDTDFVYDSDLAEFSGGQVQQKDTRHPDTIGYVSFTNDEEFDWQDGVANNSLSGGATVSAGIVDLTGVSGKKCNMPGSCGFNDVGSAGCIRFTYIPNYTGVPVGTRQILEYDANSGNNGAIFIQQLGSSTTLAIDLRDSSGVTHQLYATGFNAVSGQRFVFELNFDFDGTSRFFIDGIQKGSLNTSSWTRNPTPGNFEWGGASGTGDFYMDDVVLFDSVQHTSNHSGELPYTYYTTIYVTSKVELPVMTYSGTQIKEFTGITSIESGLPKYILDDKYWNGAAWVSSDGSYSQANTLAEVNTNIGTLTPTGATLNIDVVFDDSNTQSSVDNLQVNYTGNIYAETSVVLPEMEHAGDGTIKLFNSLATTYAGSPRILLEIGRSGDKLYWNGSVWAVSDETYNQATDPTTFDLYCNLLLVDGENYGQFTIVFPESTIQSSVSELIANMNVDVYVITNPTIRPKAGQRMDGLVDWIETLGEELQGNDNIKRLIQLDSNIYYLNNGEWIITATEDYSKAMTVAEILAEKESLLTAGYGKTFLPITFLHSENGQTSPELDNDEITYNFSGEAPVLDTIIFYGYLRDFKEGLSGLTVKVRPTYIYGDKTIITDDWVDADFITTEDGYWELTVKIEDIEPTYLEWRTKNRITKTDFINQTTVKFSDLTVLEVRDFGY